MPEGEALTEVPVAADSPVEGDHAYVAAPLTDKPVEEPAQIAAPGEALNTGKALIVTVVVTDDDPQAFVAVNV